MFKNYFMSLAPDKPVIEVEKCSRSVHSVVLVLPTTNLSCEVVDGYKVHYSRDKIRPLDQWVSHKYEYLMT